MSTASQSQSSLNFESLEKEIASWQKDLNLPLVGLGIIENGKIVKSTVYSDSIQKDNTLFNVASVTKVVFTQLILKLVQKGDWDLDEPLAKYYIDPEVKDDPNSEKLTSRHVLSQQSGFVNWRWNHPTEKLTFDFEPGTQWNYSGEGMEYLRQAVESKFGKSLTALSNELLFYPLGMSETSHSWDGKTNFDRFSLAYNTDGNLHEIEDHSTIENAADDLITTVDDLCKFGIHVIEGGGLSEELYADMTKSQVAINDNMDQGLGWRVINDLSNGEYVIQHGGNDIGVAALLLLLPESKRGMIILTNGDSGLFMCNNIVRSYYTDIGKEIIHRAYKSGKLEEVPTAINLSSEDLADYNGRYIQPSGRALEISSNENGLMLRMPGTPNLDLFAEAKDTFFLYDFDPKIVFTRDEGGKADAALIVEGENVIRCEKEVD